MSYIEFFGTISGAIAVWLSAKAKVSSWPLGLINVTLFFFLFFQIQLYPDMFLQVFFFITNLIGWWNWTHPKPDHADRKHELKVSFSTSKQNIIWFLIGAASTILFGKFAQNLHEWLPAIFKLPSAFPYADSFVLCFSIIGTFLMIRKKIECWIIWLIVDILCTYIYYIKGVKFVAIEYLGFCFIAIYGYIIWNMEYRSYNNSTSLKDHSWV
jgi:nicotinamide mononucleotide transporter